MADSHYSHQKLRSGTQSKPINTNNSSYTHSLCKSLLFLLFLVGIPLFPSQAPDFISQTVLTEFWELAHLLFIGIAVSYGLFGRRNVEMHFENHPYTEHYSQLSIVSGIFHVSSIFEDEYEDPCGSDEKVLYQAPNSQYYRRAFLVSGTDGGSIVNEQCKIGSLDPENGFKIKSEHDENDVVQTWNSQYFQGDSMIVVSQPNYVLDEYDRPGPIVGHKPLGLPVRSLKSRISNQDNHQFSNGSECGSTFRSPSSSSGRSVKEENFDNVDPINLEVNSHPTDAFLTQITWRSRSGRMKMKEKVSSAASRPAYFRPLSVDETQFESLKSSSSRSTTSFSSLGSSASYSSTKHFPSVTVASKSSDSETERNGFRAYSPASQSPPATVNGEVTLNEISDDEDPTKLDERVDETDAFPSQIHWLSTSGMMETRGKVGSIASRPSHFRPLSVDGSATQFESLKSWSFRSTTSLSSQASSMSYSSTKHSPTPSVASESSSLEMEELRKTNGFRVSYPPDSQSPPKTADDEAPLNAFHLRRHSSGSLFQKDVRGKLKDELKSLDGSRGENSLHTNQKDAGGSSKDELKNFVGNRDDNAFACKQKDMRGTIKDEPKDLGGNGMHDSLGSQGMGQGFVKPDSKAATLVKASARGKSVRTIRSRRYDAEATNAEVKNKNHISGEGGRIFDEAEPSNTGKDGMEREGFDNGPIGTKGKTLDSRSLMQNVTSAGHQDSEIEVCSTSVIVEPKEDPENETDSCKVASGEVAMNDIESDAGDYTSEVDRKAGEFIAKFREQIRLQKVASMERSKGKRLTGDYFG